MTVLCAAPACQRARFLPLNGASPSLSLSLTVLCFEARCFPVERHLAHLFVPARFRSAHARLLARSNRRRAGSPCCGLLRLATRKSDCAGVQRRFIRLIPPSTLFLPCALPCVECAALLGICLSNGDCVRCIYAYRRVSFQQLRFILFNRLPPGRSRGNAPGNEKYKWDAAQYFPSVNNEKHSRRVFPVWRISDRRPCRASGNRFCHALANPLFRCQFMFVSPLHPKRPQRPE